MRNHASLGPICVLKVNLQNCKSCSLKVQKKLKQINGRGVGVKSIHIDTEEGVVTVRGVAEASQVMKAIAEVGKKAELVRFEMQPKHEEDESETQSSSKGNHMKNRKHKKAHQDDGHLRSYGYHYPMPPAYGHLGGPALARPYEAAPLPPVAFGNYRNGAHCHRYYVPLPRHRPPPLHYRDRDATSLVHTFNDFNPHACIIL